MIKFFKNIKDSLLLESKTRKYLKYTYGKTTELKHTEEDFNGSLKDKDLNYRYNIDKWSNH